MKKNIFFILIISLFSLVGLTACNSSSSIEAKFSQKEYIVSVDDIIDFYDAVIIRGTQKSEISFLSSNENVLSISGNSFKALSSGESIIQAKYENKILASVKVYVRYKLSSPANLVMQDDGTLSWDKSFAFVQEENIYAEKYEIAYKTANSEEEFTIEETEENSFVFEESGAYTVKIRPIINSKYFDETQFSEEENVYFNVTGYLDNLSISNSTTFGMETAVISWQAKENTIYDVFINGYKIYEELNRNYFSFDFSVFDKLDVTEVDVVAKDKDGHKLDTTTSFNITKLDVADVTYKNAQNDGYITWDKTISDFSFLLSYQGAENGQKIVQNGDIKEVLDGLESGIYDIQIMSLGGYNHDDFFVNSKVSNILTVAKLPSVVPSIRFVGKTVVINFAEDEYLSKYKITIGDFVIVHDARTSLQRTIDLSTLESGQHSISIVSLPSTEGLEVKPYPYEGESYANVINSNAYEYEFYVLDEIENVTHSIEDGVSYLTLGEIENANNYRVVVNNTAVETEVISSRGIITIKVDSLSEIEPNDGVYNIIVYAEHINSLDEVNSVSSYKLKSLKILDKTTEGEYENGGFAWSEVEGGAYRYEIYRTQRDFVISEQPIISKETTSLEIEETLSYGYYVVRVITISLNEDEQLNSNFYDQNGFLQESIIVTQKIESPTINFLVESGAYKLEIGTSEFASEYKVYIDNNYEDSAFVSDDREKATYTFLSTFTDAKTYSIRVVATSGNRFDSQIFLKSDGTTISLTKLALPTFSVQYVSDEFGVKTHENFVVAQIENEDYPEIKLNGQVVNQDKNSVVDFYDYSTFGEEFVISVLYKAIQPNGNQYFIDSEEKFVTFKRLETLTAINFVDSKIVFEDEDYQLSQGYYGEVEVVTENGNFNYGMNVSLFCVKDGINVVFNVQTMINMLKTFVPQFNSIYRTAEYFNIKLYSLINSYSEENALYRIVSMRGTTLAGENALKIEQLDEPVISLDVQTKTVNWEREKQGTVYDIYVNGTLRVSNYSSTSILLSDIIENEDEYLSSKAIKIIAKNNNYLDSNESNTINVKKFDKIKRLSIAKVEETYVVSITISRDSTEVDEIRVNGSSQYVTLSGNTATFDIANYAGQTNFEVQIIAKNTSDENYYLNSDKTIFTIAPLSQNAFTAQLNGNEVSYNQVATDIKGNNTDPIVYHLVAVSNGNEYEITTTDLSYSILDIEEAIGARLNGQVPLTITAQVDKNYYIELVEGVKGYYGSVSSNVVSLTKLETVPTISSEVVDDETKESLLDQKLNASVKLTFDNIWTEFGNVDFNINLLYEDGSEKTVKLYNGVVDENYKLALNGNKYELTLGRGLIETGVNSITIIVSKVGFINSNEMFYSVTRYENASDVEISDEGVLTITENKDAYVVNITVGNRVIERTLLGGESLDLMTNEILLGQIGEYIVRVVAFDRDNGTMPSYQEKTLRGYKLEGIESVEILDTGDILFTLLQDDFSNLVWSARTIINNEEITFNIEPVQDEETSNYFTIPAVELIGLVKEQKAISEGQYTFEFTVQKTGAIQGDWISLTFNYAYEDEVRLVKGDDLTKSYLLFNVLANDKTSYFRLTLTDEEDNKTTVHFGAFATRGYWVEDATAKFFSFTKTESTSLNYQDFYGVSVNDIINCQGRQFGKFYIDIARVTNNNGNISQYSEKHFEVEKLRAINASGFKSDKNYLNWMWSAQAEDEKTPTSYYVLIDNTTKEINTRVEAFKQSLDLREDRVGLIANDSYALSVIAVSTELEVISSAESTSCILKRYDIPPVLKIEDGEIIFDTEILKQDPFIKAITDYLYQAPPAATESQLFDIVYENTGSSLFSSSSSFASSRVKLKFTPVDSGLVNPETYYVSVNSFQLIKDFQIETFVREGFYMQKSFITAVSDYADTIRNTGTSNAIKVFVEEFAPTLKKSNQGIGDDMFVFDDAGRKIPAGNYKVSVLQANDYSNKGTTEPLAEPNVESRESAVIDIYLTASPDVQLKDVNDQNEIEYSMVVNPSRTLREDSGEYVSDYSKKFRMLFRYGSDGINANLIKFDILYDSGEWKIYYIGQDGQSYLLEDVIETINVNSVNKFRIKLKILRQAVNSLGERYIEANNKVTVDVFAYSGLNEMVINGKSAVFTLNYRDLNVERQIKVEQGNLKIDGSGREYNTGLEVDANSGLEEGAEIFVRYKHSSSQESNKTVVVTDGTANITLERNGLYEYVILSLKGSLSADSIEVGSESYAITKVYMLQQPTLTTTNNNIRINYLQNDLYYMSSLQFMLGNNLTLDNLENAYYHESILDRNNNGLIYTVGQMYKDSSIEGEKQANYETELTANEFTAFLKGVDVDYVKAEEDGNYISYQNGSVFADYKLESNVEYTILSSLTSTLEAKMLPGITGLKIENGNVVWTGSVIENDLVGLNGEEAEIVYLVNVEYYSDNSENAEHKRSDSYYTTNCFLNSDYISTDYDYYKISVTTLAGVSVSQSTANAIQTIEGGYYLFTRTVYFDNVQGTEVLRSKVEILGENSMISRTKAPFLSNGSLGIENGKVAFKIAKPSGFITGQDESKVAERISVYAEYTENGFSRRELVSTKEDFQIITETTSGEGNNLKVVFTPKEGVLNNINPFVLKIYIYENAVNNQIATLNSKPLVLENMNKLNAITEQMYSVVLRNDNTILDFSKYFTTVVLDKNSYALKVTTTNASNSTQESEISYNLPEFVLSSDVRHIVIQAINSQSSDVSVDVYKMIINSDVLEMDVENTEISLNIVWDSLECKFEWEEGEDFEYFYDLSFSGKDTKESGLTANNYYMPNSMGTISSFIVKARKHAQTEGILYLFSQEQVYEGDTITINLFSSGNGSKTNPYIIRTTYEFLNMAKRNAKGSEFYFKFNFDKLEFDISDFFSKDETKTPLFETFYGHIDGNGKTLKISSDSVYGFAGYSTPISGMGTEAINFNKYSSMFGTVNSGATIENINLEYSINYRSLQTDNILFAPIAIYNYGTIANVNITSFEITALNGSGVNNVLVGGLVSLNFGKINNCSNSAEMNYSMYSNLSMNFGYGGISALNLTNNIYVGEIKNCFNSGEKSINVVKNSNVVYLAGIALINNSKISICGNDGDFSISSTVTSYNAYVAGITVISNNGTLEYLYNNGKITKKNSSGTLYSGGIVYSLASGTINTLVDTTSSPLVSTCSRVPRMLGSNYTDSSSTASSITTQSLQEKIITAGTSNKLYIESTSNGFKARID